MFAWLKTLLKRKPRPPQKYLILRFSDPIEPLRSAKVLEETETTFLIRTPVHVFGIHIPDWEQRISKKNSRIIEVFTRPR